MICRNDSELLKRGLESRIMMLGAKVHMLEAQKDLLGALEANQRKIDLLFVLTDLINKQVKAVTR